MSKLRIADTTEHIQQTLHYGNERIHYRLSLVAQARHKIKINVLPNGTVQVIAPQTATLKTIKQTVQKRAGWIYKHLCTIKNQHVHVLPREYVSGESHFYLGRRYVLKVIKVKHATPDVKLFRGQIRVRTTSPHPEIIKSLLNNWYLEHAKQVFARRLATLVPTIRWLKSIPDWKLREMKKQWGSCSSKGGLTLNPKLVKASRECIDYVIVHELCHIKEHNHSKKYYRLLTSILPGWDVTKANLDNLSELLLST